MCIYPHNTSVQCTTNYSPAREVAVSQRRFTVNNGAPVPLTQPPSRITAAGPRETLSSGNLLPRSVTVTPKPPNVIEKVFLKTVSKDKAGKNPKVFTLRNIDSMRIISHDLKNEIRTQL